MFVIYKIHKLKQIKKHKSSDHQVAIHGRSLSLKITACGNVRGNCQGKERERKKKSNLVSHGKS